MLNHALSRGSPLIVDEVNVEQADEFNAGWHSKKSAIPARDNLIVPTMGGFLSV